MHRRCMQCHTAMLVAATIASCFPSCTSFVQAAHWPPPPKGVPGDMTWPNALLRRSDSLDERTGQRRAPPMRSSAALHNATAKVLHNVTDSTSAAVRDLQMCTQVNKQGWRPTLTPDEVHYAKCPPGHYLSHRDTDNPRRNARLRAAICAAKARGWKGGNPRESSHYVLRGYATFESSVWPKPVGCRVLPDEIWNAEFNSYYDYRTDTSPVKMVKYVSDAHNGAEFHQSWKVASTSFPEYLRCEYGSDTWKEVVASTPIKKGAPVISAVRHPIARWISAASEMLERAMNRWCPNGPCTTKDAFDANVTLERMAHQTSWFAPDEASGDSFPQEKLHRLIRSMVHDTKCNYYTYSSEHLTSQATFVTQNAGHAHEIAVIIKLERLTAGLNHMAHRLGLPGGQISGKCNLETHNRKVDKPQKNSIPSSNQMAKILASNTEALQDLCLIYAQDFVCFDYELPEGCQGLF